MGKGGEVRGIADRLGLLFERDLGANTSRLSRRKPVSTFPDHALDTPGNVTAAALFSSQGGGKAFGIDAEKMNMRHMMLGLFGLLSASAVTMAGTGPAAAFDYPFCIQGGEFGVPGDCSYPSYEACLATASGRNVYCNINPRVAFRAPQLDPLPQPEPRHHGRRYYRDPNY
jgi:hypothetical protein